MCIFLWFSFAEGEVAAKEISYKMNWRGIVAVSEPDPMPQHGQLRQRIINIEEFTDSVGRF